MVSLTKVKNMGKPIILTPQYIVKTFKGHSYADGFTSFAIHGIAELTFRSSRDNLTSDTCAYSENVKSDVELI